MTIKQKNTKILSKKKKRRDSQLETQRNIYLENEAYQLFLSDGLPLQRTYKQLRSQGLIGYAEFYLRKVSS